MDDNKPLNLFEAKNLEEAIQISRYWTRLRIAEIREQYEAKLRHSK